MTPPHPFRIVPCNEWGAAPPRGSIVNSGPYNKAIFHHTAGHHAELPPYEPTETFEEACNYGRIIQTSHFRRGWLDTGNNFLVCRSGHILEGRHRSLELLSRGMMPESAHCPGQNGQNSPDCGHGVEIEHVEDEEMTPTQYAAAVWLFALILRKRNLGANRIYGHKDFIATECPANLYADLPAFRADVTRELAGGAGPGWATPRWFVPWAKWYLRGRDEERRPSGVPGRIPPRAFLELDKIGELYLEKSGRDYLEQLRKEAGL